MGKKQQSKIKQEKTYSCLRTEDDWQNAHAMVLSDHQPAGDNHKKLT
jgi:hypothetical protein